MIPLILVFLRGENGKIFLWNFFEQPIETLRPADLKPLLCTQAFMIPVFLPQGLIKFLSVWVNKKNC